MQSFPQSRPYIIAIDGPIGVGKSTAIKAAARSAAMAGNQSIVFLTEPVDDWTALVDAHGKTLLERYYANPAEHVFALQTVVFVSMYSQIASVIRNNPQCTVIVQERSVQASTYVFARMMLDKGIFAPEQHAIYLDICRQCVAVMPEAACVDEIIYLHASVPTCLARIAARARPGEMQIAPEYLETCEAAYAAWLSHPNAPIPYVLDAERGAEYIQHRIERMLCDSLARFR
jgi:deoxyadenosine/deoxycytidine kinase